MRAKYIGFNNSLKSYNLDSKTATKVLAIAIALGLSEDLALPSSPADTPASYFNLTHSGHLNKTISEWNENVIFDAKLTMEMVRNFWTIRYYAAYPKERPTTMANTAMSMYSAMFTVGFFISPEIEDLFSNNASTIFLISRAVVDLGKEDSSEG